MAKSEKKPKSVPTNEVSKTSIDNPLQTIQQNDTGVNSPTMEMQDQMKFLSDTAKTSFQTAENARRRYDQEWLGRNMFWRGYQFSKYLPSTQTIVLSVRQSAFVPVNMTAAYMRAIRNQVTSFRPKFEILPTVPNNEKAKIQARYAQRLLDYYFDKLKLKMKIKETIVQALMYSIGGPWQIVYDERTKEIKIWLLDPFDFYIDPLAEDPNEAEYMIKAVRRPVGEVLSDPTFNMEARKEIKSGESALAASPQKQFMIQSTRVIPTGQQDSSSYLILKEGKWRKYRENGDIYTVQCIWSDQNTIPLYYKELDEDEQDYIVYRGDIVPKEIYGESWMKHVMTINRVINTLESSVLEYNTRVAKGRIVVDRDSGVRAIHNVHGEIITKNRGATIQAMDMPMLPSAVPEQINRMFKYSMDIAAVHEASLGAVPTNVRTGIGIAELKQSDATGQDDLVDNLEDFLTEVAMKILKKIAQNYSSYKVIKDLGVREGDEKYFAVVGKKFAGNKKKAGDNLNRPGQVKIGADWFDVAEIADDNNIRVTIGSWLGYTKEALQQKVLTYYQTGLIDQKTALRLLEFGDIDDIIHQTRSELILKKATQNQQPGQGQQVDQYDLAIAENDMMLEGKKPPVESTDDHLVHIALHQEALGRGMDQIVGEHIEEHQIRLEAGIGQPGMTTPSEQPQQPAQMPGQVPQEAPPGLPPGQGLPQQDMAQSMMQNTNQAASAMAPATEPSI